MTGLTDARIAARSRPGKAGTPGTAAGAASGAGAAWLGLAQMVSYARRPTAWGDSRCDSQTRVDERCWSGLRRRRRC